VPSNNESRKFYVKEKHAFRHITDIYDSKLHKRMWYQNSKFY